MDGYDFANGPNRRTGVRPSRGSNESLDAQLALGPRLLKLAFKLRYEAYRPYGYIGENSDRLFSDRYDEQTNCCTVLVYKKGAPAATVRVSVFDPDTTNTNGAKLQAMEIFADEISETMAGLRLAERQPRVMEIAKLARLPEHAGDINVVFALYRAAGYLILRHDADIVFNAVRSHHIPMYRRFGFEPLTAPRSYPGLSFQTTLMACFRPSYATARSSLPFLRGISKDDAAYAGLIAGERVAIFGDNAPSAVRPAGPVVPLSQTPDGLHNCA